METDEKKRKNSVGSKLKKMGQHVVDKAAASASVASGRYHAVTAGSGRRKKHNSLSCERAEVDDWVKWQPLEGLLYKYTNVMKGYQYRWFTLNPETGKLEYFEREELKRQKPRGSLFLAGAVISPSDEDSQTFSVNAANGEIYKLRAFDAKERQHWVNRLRATAEHHTDYLAQSLPPLVKDSRPHSLPAATAAAGTLPPQPLIQLGDSTDNLPGVTTTVITSHNNSSSSSKVSLSRSSSFGNSKFDVPPGGSLPGSFLGKTRRSFRKLRVARSSHKGPTPAQPPDSLKGVRDVLQNVQTQNNKLVNSIEDLPSSGEYINSLDQDMLLLKATSNATMACLEQCLSILQQQQSQASVQNLPGGGTIEWLDPKGLSIPRASSATTSPLPSPADSFISATDIPISSRTHEVVPIDHDEDVEDEAEYTDTDLGAVEEHKSIILHLLSQLKLGMDLTKVVLPTFILEKRSLLEMFADCMAHPDIFQSIPDQPTPEQRMLAVLEWYLTSFHAGRKGAIAKKPYNPIIGETFHCSWRVKNRTCSAPNGNDASSESTPAADETRLYYHAEQVSHHPPISAFYFECPDKQMSMNASVWTKSKFMGMSIGVVMVGKVTLRLLAHEEDYTFTLPSAYARSILTVPWVELGDRVTLTCNRTGFAASVVFHTKPFYGGKLHKISAEVKNPQGDNVCKVAGEWNGLLEFTYANGESKLIDTATLQTIRKCVRPLHLQSEFESRRLWQNVTSALQKNDINLATQHKRFLEERQRQGERVRKENNAAFPTKHFHKTGDVWLYNKPLQKLDNKPLQKLEEHSASQ